MKKTIRLNERELHNLISESVKRIMNESSSDTSLLDAWDNATEQLGPEQMLDALYKAMGEDQIRAYLEYIDRMYELNLFDDDMYMDDDVDGFEY